MARRKKLLNSREAATHEILKVAAGRNEAQAFPKMRIADVLELNNSGISKELFSYALKAHFDFVVADGDHEPLFAVEYDGPTHEQDHAPQQRDLMKNTLCERFGFPLARVRDEHIFKKARGIDYLTWLTEMYFGYESLCRAQEQGLFPPDEPPDPMSFVSIPSLPGRFPLFISAAARVALMKRYEAKQLRADVPLSLRGYDRTGRAHVFAMIPLSSGGIVSCRSDIYLRGFGIPPSEAAEEVAVVNLNMLVREQLDSGGEGVAAHAARQQVIKFLREYRVESFTLSSPTECGFDLSFDGDDKGALWIVGALGNEPAERIEVRRQ